MADDQSGFMLVEVLVAVTILALGSALLVSTIRTSIHLAEQSSAQEVATNEAQSLLAGLGHSQTIVDGTTAGSFPSGDQWDLVISPFGDEHEDSRVTAHNVQLVVRWQGSNTDQGLTFRTVVVAVSP